MDGQYTNILYVFPVTLADQGNYSCQVLDNMGSVIETAQAGSLFVYGELLFTNRPI